MFSTETITRDSSINSFYLTDDSFFNPKHVPANDENHFLHQNQNYQKSCGLASHRSAPNSFFTTLLDTIKENDDHEDNSSGDDELEEALIFSSLLNDLNQSSTQVHAKESSSGYWNDLSSVGILRQSSSPATFFTGLSILESGNYQVHNHHSEAESSPCALNNTSFTPGLCSNTSFMPSILEYTKESFSTSNPENNRSNNKKDAIVCIKSENTLPCESPNQAPFKRLKRNRDDDFIMFSNSSLCAEMSEVEKPVHIQQDTAMLTTCQRRAKRGCATHPRSIAERNRRSRISENMKKLQDLCPNTNKQTSTADMLDLAVEYIKDLQKHVQILSGVDAKCICSSKPQEHSPTT